jgi:hypothetical protein
MGTRSLTYVIDAEDRHLICCLYRHYDGSLEGHGQDLMAFLEGMRVVNGLPWPGDGERLANGPEELAALLVWHFKGGHFQGAQAQPERGNIYLHPPAWPRDDWQEYEYFVLAPRTGAPSLFYRKLEYTEGGTEWGPLQRLMGPLPTDLVEGVLSREAAG